MCLALVLLLAQANEIRVQPAADGPAVIGPAIRTAPAGSVIRLAPGVYREYVQVERAITLEGEPGAVVDPSQPFDAAWEPAPDVGAGVYRAEVSQVPYTLFLDGKVLAQVNPRRKETMAEGDWNWKTLLLSGTPRTGFRMIRGLWLYLAEEHAVYLHLEDDASPAGHSWTAVWKRDAAVSIRASNAHVRGIAVAHAYTGVELTGDIAGSSVSDCLIGPWDKYGVFVHHGAADSLVEANDIFRDSYESLTPVPDSRDAYEVWQIHKRAGLYDRIGVCLSRAGTGNRVSRNLVHDVFDGINISEVQLENLDIPLDDPTLDQDTEISENVIERTRDSGIEIGGPSVNVHVHHNLLRLTHGGLRYKLPRIGPIFIYRNVLVDGTPMAIWYSMDHSPAEAYVYHNTIVGGTAGLMYSSFNARRDIGAPRWHYLNNLVRANHGFFASSDSSIPVNFTADYNVVQGGGRPYPNDPDRDVHSRYVRDIRVAPDVPRPLPDSPAIDAGLDLSTYFHGGPLPGCEPGYFKGKAPDAGAYEIE